MKQSLIPLVGLSILLLTGCTQSDLQSQYDTLQAEYQTLQEKYDKALDDVSNLKSELNDLKQAQKEQTLNNGSKNTDDNKTNSKWIPITLQDTISTGFCEITFGDVRFEDFVTLTKPSNYGYRAKEGMTYCALDIKTKNIYTKPVKPEGVFVKFIVNDTYEYNGSCVNAYIQSNQLEPLATGDYIIIAQMPKEIQNTYQKITLQIGMPENFGISQFVFEDECQYFYQCDIANK